ncbi:curculin (mannose-binding) lectin [Burkholderia sp. 22PA0099]|uniref:curculin (mannose-binding) lectin n=1 Tax=Burkholderia sp. 22PA0099 TaxID=3237372 RepID=UPI0039C04A1F
MKKGIFLFLGLLLVHLSSAFATVIPTGTTLYLGAQVCSENGQYCLDMQASDGNLVLYGPTGALWASGTANKGATRAVMQPDGNFVVYTSANVALLVLNTEHAGAYLNVQNDGNLALYWDRAIWQSNTSDPNSVQTNQGRILHTDSRIPVGASYTVGQYFLILQADGNFALYKNGVPIWYTATAGKGVTAAWMQNDGNLTMTNDAGAALWQSNTGGNANAYFAFQPDGNLVIYTPTVSWDRLAHFDHPDYLDHSGGGYCFACTAEPISIPF